MAANDFAESLKHEIIGAVTSFKTDAKASIERQTHRLDELEALLKRPGSDGAFFLQPGSGKNLSDQIWADGGFEAWRKSARGVYGMQFNAVEIPQLGIKTLIDSTALGNSTPGILTPQRVADIIKPGVRRIRVRDLLFRYPTQNNAIDYVRENAFTNQASPQTEGSAKAESALTFVIDSVGVKTIAHWIPATRQALDDWTELRRYIDIRLMDGLLDKEDSELLSGDGLGNHVSGLITEATAYNTSFNLSGDTRIDKLRHAIKQLAILNFEADGFVLNPQDWEVIELIKTEEGGANKGLYIMGGPANQPLPFIWGKPVALTTAMTAGTFLVADFRRAAAVYQRTELVIDLSTEHASFFIENKVAIRAEERLALAIFQNTALVHGSF